MKSLAIRLFLGLLICAVSIFHVQQCMAASDAMTVGPLAIQPAATIYVVVGDQPVDVRLTIRRNYRAQGDRLTIRAFDPDEKITFWQFVKAGQLKDSLGPGDMEIYGIPIQIPVKPQPNELMYDATILLKGKGVHQIRLASGTRNSVATLAFSQSCSYGIGFQNGWYTVWDKQIKRAYAYVPPHAQSLKIMGGPVTVSDDQGKTLGTLGDVKSNQTIPVTKTNILWQFDLPQDKYFKFRASGFPLILCPTPEAARAIHASVITLDDGTVVCHKFQEKIAKLLPQLLKPENVGDAKTLIQPLAPLKEAYLADPLRNKHLLNPYGFLVSIPEILRNQNVDPASHWSGATGGKGDGKGGWKERINLPTPQNRWDTLGSIKGLSAGASPHGSDTESLAWAYEVDASVNPYHGKKELLYRAAAASLRDLMTLGEDENWRGVGADNTDYAGMMAFAVAQKTFPVYHMVAPHMSPEVREVWTEGLRHIVDRIYPENMVTCRNQSSHYLVAFEAFAQGSGLTRYAELAKNYARRFVNEAHPSGYQIEQCGPDSSYIGMTHWHEAVYYRMSKDPVILEGIRKSYNFFNHTVAPEPNHKTVLGGFNFNHRIGEGFYGEQWSGAKGILDDVLPEVGLWTHFRDESAQAIAKAKTSITRNLVKTVSPTHSNIHTMKYVYYTDKPDQSMVLPAMQKRSFIRNLNDELIAVKRPGYYAVVFTGHPAPSEYYVRLRENFRTPYANDAESNGGEPNLRKITPYVGGGLSLFWTPNYGSAILATNWSPLTHHGLVAQQQNKKRYWEDYFKHNTKFNKNTNTLTINGTIEKQGIDYIRTYKFDRDAVHVSLKLTAFKDVSLLRLIENLPLANGSKKASGVHLTASNKQSGDINADHISILDDNGHGMRVTFDETQALRLVPNGMKRRGLQISRVEVVLPAKWQSGQTYTLYYTLQPVSKSGK